MDTITLESGKTYEAIFAADSLSTGNFVAKIVNAEVVDIVRDFPNPGAIVVDNLQTGRHVYSGYRGVIALKRFADGILVTLGREE